MSNLSDKAKDAAQHLRQQIQKHKKLRAQSGFVRTRITASALGALLDHYQQLRAEAAERRLRDLP